VAFNYGEWDQLTVQLAVFTTLAILVAYLVSALRGRLGLRSAVLPAIALIGLVAVQVALLIEGDSMLRWWQNAEYKELLVALALLLWAVEVARRPAPRSDLPDGDRSRR
jgi:4-amino-4-deoxy-L-arabinose transferase-like glycosyltransferase